MKKIKPEYERSVVTFASEILDMKYELHMLRKEVEELREYRDKYAQLLESDINHGKVMLGNLLDLALRIAEKDGDTNG